MTDKVVTLRIVGENGQLVASVKASQAELDKLGRGARTAGAQGSAGLNQIGESAQRGKRDLDAMGGSVASLQRMVTGAAIGAFAAKVAGAFVTVADRAGQLEARVRNATESQREFEYVMERSAQVAHTTYQSINTVAEIAINAAGPMRQLGYSVNETLDLTEAMSLALVASAADQQRSANTIIQFSRAMQQGVLRGEQFNSVLENAPEFVSALERALGKTRGELIQMAHAGQLTVAELVKVSSEIETLTAKVEAMPTTVEDAWVRFGDKFQEQAKRVNESSNATGYLVLAVELLGDSLGTLVTVAGIATVAIGGRLVAALTAKTAVTLRAAAAMGVSTAATVAKTRAVQGLNVAMGAFGGPAGLAITALTLFVLWSTRSAARARELAETVKEGFQGALATLQDFNRESANEAFAGYADGIEQLENARELVGTLKRQESELDAARKQQLSQYGVALKGTVADLEKTSAALELQERRLELLESAHAGVVDRYADMVLGAADVTGASEAQRQATEEIISELLKEGMTLQQLQPQLVAHMKSTYDLEAANRLAEVSFRDLEQAANIDWTDIDKSLEQMIDRSTQRYIETTQGKAAAARAALEKALVDAGGHTDPEAAARRRELLEIALALDAQTEQAVEAQRRRTAATREGEQELRRLTEAQVANGEEVERQVALLEGPLRAAEYERDQRLKQLGDQLREGAISQRHHDMGQKAAEEQYRRTTAEIRNQQDVMAQAAADYVEEIRLSSMSASARRVEEQVIRRVADAKRAGRELSVQEIADLRRFIGAQEQVLDLLEDQAAMADHWERRWDSVIHGTSRALGDWMLGVRTQYEDLGDALKDITRRFLSDIASEFMRDQVLQPIRQWFSRLMSGGFAQAGGSGGGGFGELMGALFGGGGGGGVSGWAGNVGQAMRGWLGGTASGPQGAAGLATVGGAAVMMPGAALAGGTAIGAQVVGVDAAGNPIISAGGQLLSLAGGKSGSSFLTSAAAPWLAGAAGALYGWNRGGDTAGRVGGAAAYGVAGYGLMAGAGTAMAGVGMGVSAGASAAAGLAAVPVAGWIALAAIAIDKISGGKLFGTSFRPESAAVDLAFGGDGASGSTTLTEVRNRSLFRGRKWRTTVEDLDPEAQQALDEAWAAINDSVAQAAAQLGVAVPDLVAGSFRQEFDGNGNLQREFSTIAGRVYQEAEEAFTQRLMAENLLSVAAQAGNRGELDRIANRFRASPEDLTDFATLALAMQSDIKNATALWDSTVPGSFDQIVRSMERLGQGSEKLAETYARLTGAARDYGALVGDVRAQLITADYNDYQRSQLEIELGYRNQVRQANELARALGLSGARAEDLAAIEQLRAQNMATLQRQQEAERDTWLQDLSLGNLSSLRDDQKLSESMDLLRSAVATGDVRRAQQLAQTALGFGRNLYASGMDYQALYDQVTGMVGGMEPGDELGFAEDELVRIADLLEDLPQRLASEIFGQVLAPPPAANLPPIATTPVGPPVGVGGGTSNTDRLLAQMLARLDAIEAHTGGQLRQTTSRDLHDGLNSRSVVR